MPSSRAVEDEGESDPDAHPMDRLQAFIDRASLSGQADELPDEDRAEGAVTLLTAHTPRDSSSPWCSVWEWSRAAFLIIGRERKKKTSRRSDGWSTWPSPVQCRASMSPSSRRLVMGMGYQHAEPRGFSMKYLRRFLVEANRSRAPHGPQRRRASTNRFPTGPRITSSNARGAPADLRTFRPSPDEFQPGTRVMRPTFGVGEIQRVEDRSQV